MAPKRELHELLDEQFDQSVGSLKTETDPIDWSQAAFAASLRDGILFSNQIEVVEAIHDPTLESVNALASRGAGKTKGIGVGLGSLAALRADTGIICSAPIQYQANRIVKLVTALFEKAEPHIRDKVDWQSHSASRLTFKNGSFLLAVSGQETANVEGEHGPVLYVDEAHLVPGYSMTNKLMPMNVSLDGFRKIIKSGVSMNRGHFYRSCMAPGAKVLTCPWWKAELFLNEPDPLIYRKKQFSRQLIRRMPLSYKRKYFPDRPDLHIITGEEVTEVDWRTQYELEWVSDILNILSEDDQITLASGKHALLTKGASGEMYCAGLDTAPGSGTGRWSEVDKTVLAIWRIRKNGLKERVACFTWQGNVLEQEEEIWQIVNQKTGLFKCEVMMADYSNIAVPLVEKFKKAGMPVVGVQFAGTATKANSKKNWKNALYDHYMVELQSENIRYPSIQQMKERAHSAGKDEKVQIENMMEGFFEWCILQRIKGRGLNDQIEAPQDDQEDTETGLSKKSHDDHPTADVLAVWACDHHAQLKQEAAKGGVFGSFEFPIPVIGPASSSMMAPDNPMSQMMRAAASQNPYAQESARQGLAGFGAGPAGGPAVGLGAGDGLGYIGNILDGAIVKKGNRR